MPVTLHVDDRWGLFFTFLHKSTNRSRKKRNVKYVLPIYPADFDFILLFLHARFFFASIPQPYSGIAVSLIISLLSLAIIFFLNLTCFSFSNSCFRFGFGRLYYAHFVFWLFAFSLCYSQTINVEHTAALSHTLISLSGT